MKQKLFILGLSLGLSAAMGCSDQPVAKEKNERAVTQNDCGQAVDTVNRVLVPLTKALKDIYSYDSLNRLHWKGTTPIESYTIRAVDLLAAMGMPATLADSSICRFKYVRVYMAFRNKVGFKLYIMPVDNACLKGNDPSKWKGGNDVLLDKNGNPIMIPLDSTAIASDDEYLLDLNAPCPNTCPSGKPLKDHVKAL
jgi:hypothetical protein